MVRQRTERPFADQLTHEGDAAPGHGFHLAVAFVLGDVEVGLAFVDDRDQQGQVTGRAARVPGVPLAAETDDVPQASVHLGVLVLKEIECGGELVAAVLPGPLVPGLLVAAVLAVQERELGRRRGCELAEPAGDKGGLAVARQTGDADPGQPAQRQVPVVAEVVPADVEHIWCMGFVGAGWGTRPGCQWSAYCGRCSTPLISLSRSRTP